MRAPRFLVLLPLRLVAVWRDSGVQREVADSVERQAVRDREVRGEDAQLHRPVAEAQGRLL